MNTKVKIKESSYFFIYIVIVISQTLRTIENGRRKKGRSCQASLTLQIVPFMKDPTWHQHAGERKKVAINHQ